MKGTVPAPPCPKPMKPPISRDGEASIIHQMSNAELRVAIDRTISQISEKFLREKLKLLLQDHLKFLLEIEAQRAAAWRLNVD
jgi:hypothetical protein